jgi:hypothetical protein
MKRKVKKPAHSRLIRKWDGTDLVPDLPPLTVDAVDADAEIASDDRKPLSPQAPTLEHLFADEEETIEYEQ